MAADVNPESLRARVLELLDARGLVEAVQLLTQLIGVDPENEWTYRQRGVARSELGDTEGARADHGGPSRKPRTLRPFRTLEDATRRRFNLTNPAATLPIFQGFRRRMTAAFSFELVRSSFPGNDLGGQERSSPWEGQSLTCRLNDASAPVKAPARSVTKLTSVRLSIDDFPSCEACQTHIGGTRRAGDRRCRAANGGVQVIDPGGEILAGQDRCKPRKAGLRVAAHRV
jgi:hypothetical protein